MAEEEFGKEEDPTEDNLEAESSSGSEAVALIINVRCPTCDYLLTEKVERCLMCGSTLEPELFMTDEEKAEAAAGRARIAAEEAEKTLKRRFGRKRARSFASKSGNGRNWQPTPFFGLSVFFSLFTIVIGGYGFINPEAIPIALLPSPTPTNTPQIILPTQTPTPIPSATPLITNTPTATIIPTETSTPLPTDTPEPLRTYTILSGQTWVGIAALFGYTLESVYEANDINPNADPGLFEGQEIFIPWPTATPPLQPYFFELGDTTLVIDPSNCPPFYEIQEGDSLFGLASRNDIPLEALLEMNYLTVDSIVQPGDVICIPQILDAPIFVATPGPSPTPAPTQPPTGPQPLFPPNQQTYSSGESVFLQWLSEPVLPENTLYMVEVIDLTNVDSHPKRLFTRSSGVTLPADWRPSVEHDYVWRVSLVEIDGRRENGGYIYSIVGAESVPRYFSWGS